MDDLTGAERVARLNFDHYMLRAAIHFSMSKKRPGASAASLPTQRLPLGTPVANAPTIPAESTSPVAVAADAQAAPPAVTATTSHGKAKTPLQSPKPSHSKTSSKKQRRQQSAPKSPAAMSLAESKLQRQNQRIQAAEDALHAPLPAPPHHHHERERPSSRKPKNVWQKFDFAAPSDTSQQQSIANDGGVPVSEVRISRFHAAPSRATSLSRSMSSLSHHTADADRGADDGFIVHTSHRRSRKESGQLSVYEEKQAPKQATVEATFDEREVLKVFKVPLPGPGWIDQNWGSQDGVVQFVQHPNGDVSAHQWSAQRFQWENIGQFSNIRKRVEGQLGSDRLRGQTASQTLLMNSLEFFRTIAKQREATIMGLPWGAKEIEALLPDAGPVLPGPKRETVKAHVEPYVPKIDLSTALTAQRTVPSLPSLPQIPQQKTTQAPSFSLKPIASNPVTVLSRSNAVAVPQHIIPAPQSTTPSTARFDGVDPFYTAEHYKSIYGSQSSKQPETPSTPSKPLLYNSFGALAALKSGYDGSRTPIASFTPTDSFTPSVATMQPIRQSQIVPPVKEDNSFKESFERMTTQAIKRNGISDLRAFAGSEEFIPKTFVPPPPSNAPENKNVQHTPPPKLTPSTFSVQTPQQQTPPHITHASPFQDHVKDPKSIETSDSYQGANTFQRQQDFYETLKAADKNERPYKYDEQGEKVGGFDMTRMLLPVAENLAAYTGPTRKRDYFSQWVDPPEYAVDRGPRGNDSFYDPNWGTPPARIGRDPRYQPVSSPAGRQSPARPLERLRFGEFGSSASPTGGLDRRFQHN